MDNALFIKTKDKSTAENLQKCGYELISMTSGVWTFANCKQLHFSDKIDVTKVIKDNKLFM